MKYSKRGEVEMGHMPKSLIFKKYIVSYIAVFSIPFLILLIVVNSIYISNVRQELNAANENYLEQTNVLLNEQMIEMRSLGNYINETNFFNTRSAYNRDNFSDYQDLLKQHEHSSRSIKSIYVIVNPTSYVFSSRGNMSVDAMLDHAVQFSNLTDIDVIRNSIDNSEERLIAQNKRLYYTMPLGENGYSYGSILFVMDTHSLLASMNALTERDEGMSFLVDENNEIILSSSLYPKLRQDSLVNKVSEIISTENVKIDNTNYLSSSITNDLVGWTFISLVDSNRFYQPLYEVLFFVFSGVFILTIFGVLISYYFAIRNYRPIHKLSNVFEKEINQTIDEWNFIQTNITRTYSEVKILNSLVNEQAPIIRNAVLLDLIEGRYNEQIEFQKNLEENKIHFPYLYYTLLIIELGDRSIEADQMINVEKLSQNLNNNQKNEQFHIEATIPHFRNNQIFVIANLRENNLATMDKVITFVQQVLTNEPLQHKRTLKVGAGSTHKSWKKIKNSYIEASSALEELNKRAEKNDQVLFFEDINQNQGKISPDFLHYPKEKIMLLLQSLKQGNIHTAQETIQDTFEIIKDSCHNTIAVQAITASLFNSVIQTANELGLGSHSQLLLKLNDFSDIASTKELLIEISEAICSDMRQKQECESSLIEKNVVQFIFEYYNSPSISLEQIASENNISISYASKLIKEETGESFSNILQSLRMNRFKELLLTTNSPIKELVTEVGYYDVSNFTRKFRQENEMTPGQYRKKYKKPQLSSTTI